MPASSLSPPDELCKNVPVPREARAPLTCPGGPSTSLPGLFMREFSGTVGGAPPFGAHLVVLVASVSIHTRPERGVSIL